MPLKGVGLSQAEWASVKQLTDASLIPQVIEGPIRNCLTNPKWDEYNCGVVCVRSIYKSLNNSLKDLTADRLGVFYTDNAIFWGELSPHPCNENTLFANEVLWRSTGNGDGKLVLRAFEEWADLRGATHICVLSFFAYRQHAIERYMTGAGFETREVLFIKKLV